MFLIRNQRNRELVLVTEDSWALTVSAEMPSTAPSSANASLSRVKSIASLVQPACRRGDKKTARVSAGVVGERDAVAAVARQLEAGRHGAFSEPRLGNRRDGGRL